MIRLLTDENFDQRIILGLYLRLPQLDWISVQQAGLRGLSDPILLKLAASQNRILVTHDIHTVPRYAIQRVTGDLPMPGVIIVPDTFEIGKAIADLEIIVECCTGFDLNNQLQYLPL